MKKIFITFLVLLAMVGTGYAEILVQDGAESAPSGNYVQHQFIPNESAPTLQVTMGARPPGMEIGRSDFAYSGNYSYRMFMPYAPPGDYDTGNDDLHAEFVSVTPISGEQWPNNFAYGVDYWIAFRMFIPSDFEYPDHDEGNWSLIWQFHHALDACDEIGNPPIGFLAGSDTFFLTIRWVPDHCGTWEGEIHEYNYPAPPPVKGQWNLFVLNFMLSYTAGSGYFNCWLNGNQFANHIGPNTYNDDNGDNFQIGPYGPMQVDLEYFMDDFRIGKNSSYLEMTGETGEDTTPPILSIGSIPTQPNGTTQYEITITASDLSYPVTVKADTSDVGYDSAANTATNTGDPSIKTFLATGLTEGTNYVYFWGQDDEGNKNTTATVASITVASASGGGGNLLNDSICVFSSDLDLSDPANAFDGVTDTGNPDSSAFDWDETSVTVTCTLPKQYTHPVFRIFGDDQDTLQSATWAAQYKANAGDTYHDVFTATSCNGRQWYTQDLSGSFNDPISTVKFTIPGTGTGWQFYELEMTGDEYSGGGVPPLEGTTLRIEAESGIQGAIDAESGTLNAINAEY